MPLPREKPAKSPEALWIIRHEGFIAIREDLSREHRERLAKNVFLREVGRVWHVSTAWRHANRLQRRHKILPNFFARIEWPYPPRCRLEASDHQLRLRGRSSASRSPRFQPRRNSAISRRRQATPDAAKKLSPGITSRDGERGGRYLAENRGIRCFAIIGRPYRLFVRIRPASGSCRRRGNHADAG